MTQHREGLVFLDLVRGVSAQAVVVGHALIFAFPGFWGRELGDGRVGARDDFFYIQSYAVVAFLALSGYLITASVKRRLAAGTFTLSGYLKDRSSRIFVPLLPAIPVVVIGDRLALGESLYSQFVAVGHGAWQSIANLLMLQDNSVLRLVDDVAGTQLAVRSIGSAAPWWTVAYEWWIYVAFAATILIVTRKSRYSGVLFLLAAFSAATVLGLLVSGNGLVLAWLVGFAFAWWETRAKALHTRFQILALIASVVATVAWLDWRPNDVYAPVVAISAGVAIFAAFNIVPRRALSGLAAPAAFVADYSYSLYLMHFSVLVWLSAVFPDLSGSLLLAVSFCASNAVGVLWWWAFEKRYPVIRKLLDGSSRPVTSTR